jgi:ABC-type transport system involved in multi-copper enzyme maturation permease subunit
MRLIGRGVFLELTRRRDVYVLLLLMGVFLVATVAVTVVGIENPSTGTFLLNLGMTIAIYAAHGMTVLVMARQIPDEIEQRTLYPLLAKPLERDTLLIGKWAACAGCGALVLGVLLVMGWAPVPRMENYHPGALAQALLLLPLSLGLAASMALLLSLAVPRAFALLIGAAVYFGGGHITGLLEQRAQADAWLRPFVWLARYLPDFSKLNLVTRYTDGIDPLAAGPFLGLCLYAMVFTAAFLVLSTWLFRRRPL